MSPDSSAMPFRLRRSQMRAEPAPLRTSPIRAGLPGPSRTIVVEPVRRPQESQRPLSPPIPQPHPQPQREPERIGTTRDDVAGVAGGVGSQDFRWRRSRLDIPGQRETAVRLAQTTLGGGEAASIFRDNERRRSRAKPASNPA